MDGICADGATCAMEQPVNKAMVAAVEGQMEGQTQLLEAQAELPVLEEGAGQMLNVMA